jgi:hypothetical protein
MYTAEVLKTVRGLTKDRLNYFVRAGYVKPKKVELEHFYLYDFSEEDIEFIRRANRLDFRPGMTGRNARERTRKPDDVNPGA